MWLIITSIILTLIGTVIIIKAINNTYGVQDLIHRLEKKQLVKFIKLNVILGFIFVFGYLFFIALQIGSLFFGTTQYSNQIDSLTDLTSSILFLLSSVFVIITSIVTVGVSKLLFKIDLLRKLDSLTAIYNHGEIKNLVEQEYNRTIRYKRKACLVMVDINAFKKLNDTYGHMAGDKVIVDFVATLNEVTRREDILGRMGGDEFLILMPETNSISAIKFIIRLKEIVNKRVVEFNGKILQYTISAGMAELNEKMQSNYERWLTEVDIDLYRHKYESKAAFINQVVSS